MSNWNVLVHHATMACQDSRRTADPGVLPARIPLHDTAINGAIKERQAALREEYAPYCLPRSAGVTHVPDGLHGRAPLPRLARRWRRAPRRQRILGETADVGDQLTL